MKNFLPLRRHALASLSIVLLLAYGLWLPKNCRAASKPTPNTLIVTNELAAGTRFATLCYWHNTGVPGPTVMIVGGVHGNEPAGMDAAEIVRHWPLLKGCLIVIPRANVTALAINKRRIPNLVTNLSNLNRNFPRAGKEEPPRGELASAIWQLALKYKPDWLLDLHEGFDFHQLNNKSVGSSIIVFPNQAGNSLADLMLKEVNREIAKPELKFIKRTLPIDGSLARASGEHLHIPSMTLETTSKQPLSKRVHQHEIMVHCLLNQLAMIGASFPDETPTSIAKQAAPTTDALPVSISAGGQGVGTHDMIRVAIYKGPGTGGAGPANLLQKLQHLPESTSASLTPNEIQRGSLTNYDVVIFAGGSGSKQAEALGEAGRTEVRKFVDHGGGYIGICAGAYLATSGFSWSLDLINARTISPKWQRGRGTVKMELTSVGRKILEDRSEPFEVLYVNGPVVKATTLADLPPINVLAWFRTEMAENNSPPGIMQNSPAIFSATYHRGRVICISPHPEQTQGLEEFVPRAVAWVNSSR